MARVRMKQRSWERRDAERDVAVEAGTSDHAGEEGGGIRIGLDAEEMVAGEVDGRDPADKEGPRGAALALVGAVGSKDLRSRLVARIWRR